MLIGLSVLLLAACCTLSWGAASAIFPPPGLPVASASTAVSGSATSATDQPTIALGDTPTAIGGDSTPIPGDGPTDTPTTPPSPTLTPTSTPQPTSTSTATPDPTPCPNPCNPWGYNFTPGTVITSPPYPQFCSVFRCIGTPPDYSAFWSQSGFVVQCQDGLFSKDGNNTLSGTCRKHNGYWRTLYQHLIYQP